MESGTSDLDLLPGHLADLVDSFEQTYDKQLPSLRLSLLSFDGSARDNAFSLLYNAYHSGHAEDLNTVLNRLYVGRHVEFEVE